MKTKTRSFYLEDDSIASLDKLSKSLKKKLELFGIKSNKSLIIGLLIKNANAEELIDKIKKSM